MPVQEIPLQFATSDGRKWTDKAAADKHQELLDMREAFNEAARQYGYVVAASQLTADGQPFKFSGLPIYYYVTKYFDQMPSLLSFSVNIWGDSVREHDGAVRIHIANSQSGVGTKVAEYAIKDLFAFRENAELALIKARRQWLAERMADLGEDEARIQQGQHYFGKSVHRKLVRDKIPTLPGNPHHEASFHTLANPIEIKAALRDKLQEEVAEYLESGTLEELADILTVVQALAAHESGGVLALHEMEDIKARQKGRFDDAVVMQWVEVETRS